VFIILYLSWILAKKQELVREVTDNMKAYKLAEASRPIMDFILELSQWYVRRSRDRFKGDDEKDKQFALATLKEVLLTLSKVMAPFTPFVSEKIFMDLNSGETSVHLENWPEINDDYVGEEVLIQMNEARKIGKNGSARRQCFGNRQGSRTFDSRSGRKAGFQGLQRQEK